MSFFHNKAKSSLPYQYTHSPKERKERLQKGVWIGIVFLAAFITFGTSFYYVASFTRGTALIAILLAATTTWACYAIRPTTSQNTLAEETPDPHAPQNIVLASPFFVAATLLAALSAPKLFSLLKGSATAQSILTPWPYISPAYFTLLGCLLGASITFALLRSRIALILAALTGFAALSVALAVYSVGFGFDPFLHQAAEKFIADTGTITPKTFYYIGQYVLTVGIHYLTAIDIVRIDRILLPALAALLPFVAYASFSSYEYSKQSRILAAIAIFTAPLASFIATTPQGVANLFILLALFAALATLPLRIPLLLSIAAITIHPIVGIPAFLGLLFIATPHLPEKFQTPSRVILGLVAAISVPAMFFVNAQLSGAALALTPGTSEPHLLSALLGLTEHRRFNLFGDLAYGWLLMRPFLFLTLAAMFVWRTLKHTQPNNMTHRSRAWLIAIPLTLIANALILAAFRFPFLVPTEQLNYASRLMDAGILALVPFALHTFARFLSNIPKHQHLMRFAAASTIIPLTLASTYLAYPRIDAYASTRGFSTSQHDVDTVRAIHDDATTHNTPYVVLANQSVSAAAIRELGFATYYPSAANYPNITPGTPVFFYPIPTSGPLHDIFLASNDTYGKREVVTRAMDLTGVNVVYFIVNDYWWDADRIIAEAKQKADRVLQPADDITVFVYSRGQNRK